MRSSSHDHTGEFDPQCLLHSRGWTFRVLFGDGFPDDPLYDAYTAPVDKTTGKRQQAGLRLEVTGKSTLYFKGVPKDEPGFEFDVTGGVNPAGFELMLAVVHPGGWRPWPTSLPFLKTPQISGILKMNTTGRYVTLEVAWQSRSTCSRMAFCA